MLVLTRKLGEEIIVTDDRGRRLKLAVLEMRSGQVKLGLTASREFTIHRSEIQERVDAGLDREPRTYHAVPDGSPDGSPE